MYIPSVENRKRRQRREREVEKMKKERRYICTVHGEIEDLADLILSTDLPAGYRREIRSAARKIKKLAEEARDSGQAMEDRLRDYYDAVEGLGFVRFKENG